MPLTQPSSLQQHPDAAHVPDVSPDEFGSLLERLIQVERPRYHRLWAYYRNPMRTCAVSGSANEVMSDRPYRQAQEWGLPPRITGVCRSGAEMFGGSELHTVSRKEIVIENDIGWRIETMVEYLFGKPLVVGSAAPDPQRRQLIGELLRLILAHNGGILLLQQLALLGSVYGYVDVLVKLQCSPCQAAPCMKDLGQPPACAACDRSAHAEPSAAPSDITTDTIDLEPADMPQQPASGSDEIPPDPAAGASHPSPRLYPDAEPPTSAALERLARMVRLEVVEPARALPLLDPSDWRIVRAYAQCIESTDAAPASAAAVPTSWLSRLRRAATRRHSAASAPGVALEMITPASWQRYQAGRLVAQGANSLGQIPLVHIQNTSVPFSYTGGSDVEPLLPLQDELNTRLSDRAHRITMQSFRMYLGKGIDSFNELPVGPGRMWTASDPEAQVIEFGGDASCPSEDAHIADVREALDKTSGVTPIAAGAIKGRIGRLTSAAALRITMQSLLARTEKKRTTYGAAIARICELALAWLDVSGLFHTTPDERRVELSWPSPLPENQIERLQEAAAKRRLGVPPEIVLRELGY